MGTKLSITEGISWPSLSRILNPGLSPFPLTTGPPLSDTIISSSSIGMGCGVVDPPSCQGSVQANRFPATITIINKIMPIRLVDSILFVIGILLLIPHLGDLSAHSYTFPIIPGVASKQDRLYFKYPLDEKHSQKVPQFIILSKLFTFYLLPNS
jgi:hypothetical protein